ncbi:MAG: spore coat protein CotJB [Defluviitaleaceae bacterium]|nr:spore coat protein CotJB [Defluviitaleaceae bacterium]
MNRRDGFLREVQKWDFAVLDTVLFLDNHPKDKLALEWYRHFQALAKKAREEYESHCGPLQYCEQTGFDSWEWTKGPWPWEVDC